MDCKHSESISMIRDSLKEIKQDIRDFRAEANHAISENSKGIQKLSNFKWQIFGGIGAITFITALIIQIAALYLTNQKAENKNETNQKAYYSLF